MEEATVVPEKRVGRPGYKSKLAHSIEQTAEEVIVLENTKIYEFELVNAYPNYKPVDKKTEKPLASPYPPLFGLSNSGFGYDDETNRTRAWRYIEGQDSIFIDEQPSLDGLDSREISNMLGQPENQLDFRNGKMLVRGIQKLRLKALMIQDCFEGKKKQYSPRPYSFRLNNPDAQVNDDLKIMRHEYGTMKLAMEATDEEMVEAAYVMGINVDDTSDIGLARIRKQFLLKAKFDPANPKSLEFFTGILKNPSTRLNYIIGNGIKNGIISVDQIPGKITWGNTGAVIMDRVERLPVATQIIGMVIDGDKKAQRIVEEIENQLNN